MMEIEYHPEAENEAADAFEWYSRIDEKLAERFKKELLRAEEWVKRSPNTWSAYFNSTQGFSIQGISFGLSFYNQRATNHRGRVGSHALSARLLERQAKRLTHGGDRWEAHTRSSRALHVTSSYNRSE